MWDTNPFQNRFKHSEISWGSCEMSGIEINGKVYLYSQGRVESSSLSLPKNVSFPIGLTHWMKHSVPASGLTDKNFGGELGEGFWIHGSVSFPVVSSARDLHYEFHDWNMVLRLWQQLQAWNKMSSPFPQNLSSEFLFCIPMKHVKTARVASVAHFFVCAFYCKFKCGVRWINTKS